MAVQYAVVRNNDRCRAGVLVLCCFIAVVLQGFATGYYQIIPNNTNNGAYITLWDVALCNSGTCGATTTVVNFTVCNQWAIVLKAAAAFYVMSCVFVYFALVFATLEFFAIGIQWIGFLLAVIYFFFSIIGWAIILGFFRNSYCGVVLADNHRLHAGFGTAVAGTGVVFIGIVFWALRACCCNPNKVRFSQAAAAPMVAPALAPAPIVTPVSYGTSINTYPAGVSYATPVTQTMGPVCYSPAVSTISAPY